MARPGPEPKKTPKHGHGGAGWTDYVNTPYTGPGSDRQLPSIPGIQWFPQVEAWWDEVRKMPHCKDWTPTDWIFAIESALFKNNLYSELFGGTVHASMIAQIRMREDQMGTTMEARRKMGIRYVDPAQVADEQAEPTDGEQVTATSTTAAGVRGIETAKSRRQQLAG